MEGPFSSFGAVLPCPTLPAARCPHCTAFPRPQLGQEEALRLRNGDPARAVPRSGWRASSARRPSCRTVAKPAQGRAFRYGLKKTLCRPIRRARKANTACGSLFSGRCYAGISGRCRARSGLCAARLTDLYFRKTFTPKASYAVRHRVLQVRHVRHWGDLSNKSGFSVLHGRRRLPQLHAIPLRSPNPAKTSVGVSLSVGIDAHARPITGLPPVEATMRQNGGECKVERAKKRHSDGRHRPP